jgi:nicotinate-nucleotide adenylyltransferase
MRIGILGGTFDPIHMGHLILAEQCRDQAKLDQVWVMPSAHPPHKADQPVTRFEQRCEMIELAIAGHPVFRVERIEKELPPPSYTAETLAELRRRHPTDEFALIVGADSLVDMPQWYEPRRVLEQAEVVAVPRPGVETWTADRLAAAVGLSREAVRLTTVNCPLIEIASRDLRQRVAEGRSIRFLVPRAVEEYVRDKKLYRE